MGTIGTILLSEIAGTAMLIVLGVGVVANHALNKTGGHGGGPLMIHWGWGLAVFAGVFVAYKTGAHLNPAVTVGLLVSGAAEYAPGIPVTFGTTITYFAAEMIGAILGAVIVYLAYKKHYDETPDGPTKLGTFSTAPGIRAYGWNLVTEIIATFVLVFVIIQFGNTPSGLGPLAVALLVVAIGASLGGPTGYAINPARDLGPRIAHALLPIKDKGSSDWGYAWVPVVGPVIGGILAGVASLVFF
ncbi:MIP/aquaporin family protein [Brachybacterium squillarum]|uniref:MIP/aquaporin family protein n=1 Tax=Brachybacterium squillarum TaxID=661979 RepID=UPI00222292B5|nr:MIP/aquaporin family protein [Brachybacterium squillarum]MCW1806066.1 aquaporin family protein [Brachybacterium squillarum]